MKGDQSYDVIVVGVGSMGASTCYQLARAGLKILGLEARSIVNDNSSHSGQTRIVRKAYFEHPDYVPLLESVYQGWKELEEVSGSQFYFPTGLAYFGKSSHPQMEAVKDSADSYGIPLKKLDQKDQQNQLPQFAMPSGYETLIEPEAGFVLTDQVIQTYRELATESGVLFREWESVTQWKFIGTDIQVETNRRKYICKKLILTAGAGSTAILPRNFPSLKVTRQLIFWWKIRNPKLVSYPNFPCWLIAREDGKGSYYGFPLLDAKFGPTKGLKVAYHYPGEEYTEGMELKVDREIQEVKQIMTQYMPGILKEIDEVTTCLYTNTEDEDFIIDFLPESSKSVVVATGFSGHGFKFVPVIGKILRDLVLNGKTEHPIDFLNTSRFVGRAK